MADRSLQCFATLVEIDDLVTGLDRVMRIVVWRGEPAASLKPGERTPTDATAVLVGFPDVSDGLTASICPNPGEHGWARLTLPVADSHSLSMTTLDIRTSWVTHDNANGLTAFERVAKQFRRGLKRPTWAWSVSTPNSAKAYRNIGFTEGAADFFDHGAVWMQDGVSDVRYGPRAPTP